MDLAPLSFTVGDDEAGVRLDKFCAARIETLSRNQLQQLNASGGITVNGGEQSDSYALRPGDVVVVDLTEHEDPDETEPTAQDIPVNVVYEDDAILVVNKPAGLVVHPAHGNWDGTLVNALLGRGTTLASLGGPLRPGIVHRLDKGTSGLIVVAKTDGAYSALAAALKDQRVEKVYHAICWGALPQRRVLVDAPIARHPVHRQRMAVVESGRPARSELFVVDRYTHFDYIRVTIFTGRTHQIRVHAAHLGNPVLGDPTYGGRHSRRRPSRARANAALGTLLKTMPRQALHASRLAFSHPVTGDWLEFNTALPEDMRRALEAIYREDRTKEVSG